MPGTRFSFEIFCIDPDDIRTENAFSKALSYSSSLWNGAEPIEEKDKNKILTLRNENGKIGMKIYSIDTSKMLTGYIETAFIVKAFSEDIQKLDDFRRKILRHLKANLKFKIIRILRDDISSYVANELYPEINIVENLLRRYLIKFFTQKVGVDWWEVTATKKMIDKIKMRKSDRKDEFNNYLNSDIEYADFDDLGTLIYKQTSGFNNPEILLEKVMSIKTEPELLKLKSDLQGNYTKYFKEFFRDKSFEKLWKELFRLRNKVAHQGTFSKSDLDRGIELAKKIKGIITEAEEQIDEIVLTTEDKEAIRNASIDALSEENEEDLKEDEDSATVYDNKDDIAKNDAIDKSGSSDFKSTANGHKIIEEEELIRELLQAESLNFNNYIGLKWFVTNYLADKGFSIGLTYSLMNILIDRNKVELYDIPTKQGYNIKAVKLPELRENAANTAESDHATVR